MILQRDVVFARIVQISLKMARFPFFLRFKILKETDPYKGNIPGFLLDRDTRKIFFFLFL